MNILKIIKRRKTIRKYKNKVIPEKILNSIIEGAIWGPSVVGSQPGKFIIIKNKDKIRQIFNVVKEAIMKIGITGRIVFLPFAEKLFKEIAVLIAVYNTGTFTKTANKFIPLTSVDKNLSLKMIEEAEISAIAAAIQNMVLVADSLGIGSCWFNMPLLCSGEINKILNISTSDKLLAMLVLGYPAEKGRRSPRKSRSETTIYIE